MNAQETIEEQWRQRISQRCGGRAFDASKIGYAFSDVLAEEESLAAQNQAGSQQTALLRLSIADPTSKMPLEAQQAGEDYFRASPHATRYTDLAGVRQADGTDTQDVLAAWLNIHFTESSSRFDRHMVQYMPGAIKRQLAKTMPTLLFDKGTKVFFPTPGYPVIKDPKNRGQAVISDVPLLCENGRWDFDLTEMGKRCLAQSGNRVAYINVPHNPTGFGYSQAQWQKLIQWALTYGVTLVVDEAYVDLMYTNRTCSVLTVDGWEKACIVLQSVSKGWSATGLRFGWVVAHPTIIKAVRMVADVIDSGMLGSTIVSALTCLKHPKWAQQTNEGYYNLHTALYAGLKKAGFKSGLPEGGLCQFTPAPKAANGVELADATACAQWLRKNARISTMGYTVNGQPWLRWAVTALPVPDCNLNSALDVVTEAARRLGELKLEF
jgi:aspartate/methionine/tyrosine aminotransferase